MADYAIGDLQGCYGPLLRLLEHIDFDEKRDRLWFVGDLVNRGPQSLEVLRFIKQLPLEPRISLGNHDLHLLIKLFTKHPRINPDDTLMPILKADDGEELGHWLRQQSILCHDPELKVVMCHAGIAPVWDLPLAQACAIELERALRADDFVELLSQMYGNDPHCWSEDLRGIERLRIIVNYFTRMRFCDSKGCLSFAEKGKISQVNKDNIMPWFAVPGRIPLPVDLIFGHWAALEGVCPVDHMYALDTGCFWGGSLTALRLQDKKSFSVKGLV